jgi:archaellum biogenesis ATPase FlaH
MESVAIQYSNRASIIPVGRDKRPLINWKEFQTRKATVDEIKEWFKKWPDANIGIVTGKVSDIAVVDVEKGGDTTGLPETTIAKTGGGGWHYYYRYSEGIENKARIRPLTDIRGEGGFVVAPPSFHSSGNRYEWIKKYANLAPFPKYLFGIKEKTDWTDIVTGVSQGQRNESAAKYIGKMMSMFEPDTWEKTVWPTVRNWNNNNNPPMPERELRMTYESIQKRAIKNPRPAKPKDVRYTWGTRFLDTHFAIIKSGNFIVVGAKRGSGKTTYTFDMARKNAELGHQVLYISLEMEEKDILDDFGRKYAGITIEEEFDRTIPEIKQLAFERRKKEIQNTPNLVFESVRRASGTRWSDIVEIINRYQIDMIFLDNLDMIAGEQGENNLERQKRIANNIMSFTAEQQIPFILVHHYRKTMAGKDYGMDELAGSGKIADAADRVVKVVKNFDVEAPYPEKYKSKIYLQKGRGYPEAQAEIYFLKGTFVDEVPSDKLI